MEREDQLELSRLQDPRKPEHHARLAELHGQLAYLLEPKRERKHRHVQAVIDALGKMLENARESHG
jgi:hypothetical protein